MPTRSLTPSDEASFLADLDYLEDLADVIAGSYGMGVDGVRQSMALHPPVLALRPGRSRRNLTREHKELIAARVPPTTLFDVFDRIQRLVHDDDGAAFVEAPLDEVEALRFAEARRSHGSTAARRRLRAGRRSTSAPPLVVALSRPR